MQFFRRIQQKLQWPLRRYYFVLGGVILLTYIASACYQVLKPLPKGLNVTGPERSADVEFLADLSYQDADGKARHNQQIFDAMLSLIEQAKTTIVIDMFLFSDDKGQSKMQHRALTAELTQALLNKKKRNPNMDIKVITDPINTVYGGIVAEHSRQLQNADVDVIITDLSVLRASNPVWSGFWYMCCQGVGNNPNGGWIANPLGHGKVTLRSYLHLFNFKANHRKTLVVDTDQGWKALISSANPHDASSLHSNVAMIVEGKAAIDVLDSERVVANFSGGDVPMVILPEQAANSSKAKVQILTEKAILQHILTQIKQLQKNQKLDLMMFYLSDREVIKALIEAQQRGVQLRVILDPNKDAFGREKNGIPNRQVAWELKRHGIDVRWCATHGEQCHSKLLILNTGSQIKQVILGSANYTARNLNNYNLETNVSLKAAADYPAVQQAQHYFDTVWHNPNGDQYSLDYSSYQDHSSSKYWIYRFMEWSGLSTF